MTSGGIPAAKPALQPGEAKAKANNAAAAGAAQADKGESQEAPTQPRKTQEEALAAVESDSETEGRLPDGGEEGG